MRRTGADNFAHARDSEFGRAYSLIADLTRLVDPAGGLRTGAAQELVLVQRGWYTLQNPGSTY